ncbi:MAG: FtsX-like permease family protein [Methanoregula sp.]|jgi:putative ABC transport system permease protein|nr:FtsX-like permease family protein [Methanoregula sp.]
MSDRMDFLTFIIAGIRNKPGRNLATIFCFAFIAVNIFSGQFLMAGAEGGVDRGISRMGADQVVVPAQYMVFLQGNGPENTMAIIKVEPSVYRMNSTIKDAVGKVGGIAQMSPQLYITSLDTPKLSSARVDIFGIDPETDFAVRPWLEQSLDHPLEPGEIITGHEINGDLSSQISISGHVYTIAGRLDPTQSSVDNTIFLRMDDAYALAAVEGIVPAFAPRISPGDVNAILIRDVLDENPDSVTTHLRRELLSVYPSRNISVIGRHFTLDSVSQNVQGIPVLLNIISAFVVIAALPLIAIIAAMVTHERQREIGLLMSMGAKKNVIFFLVIAESMVLAVIGGIAGIGASIAAFFILNKQGFLNSALQVTFAMPTLAEISLMAGVALLVVISIGSVSSLWPAYRSSMMNPYDAIRREGQ